MDSMTGDTQLAWGIGGRGGGLVVGTEGRRTTTTTSSQPLGIWFERASKFRLGQLRLAGALSRFLACSWCRLAGMVRHHVLSRGCLVQPRELRRL